MEREREEGFRSSLFQAVEFTFFTKSGTLKEQLTRANSSTNCLQIECWIKGGRKLSLEIFNDEDDDDKQTTQWNPIS